jgi:hypothetical protein
MQFPCAQEGKPRTDLHRSPRGSKQNPSSLHTGSASIDFLSVFRWGACCLSSIYPSKGVNGSATLRYLGSSAVPATENFPG